MVKKTALKSLVGRRVTFWCGNYIYTGKLDRIDEHCATLLDASVVYDTGELTSKSWADAQKLPDEWHIMLHAVESFGILK